jgi:hypothetical protein
MKTLLKYLPAALLAVVLGPIILALILGFFFLMPVEFFVASWQLAHLDGQTTGEVIESSVSYSSKGNSRSNIRYRYFVEGKEYVSNRVSVGFLSGKAYETGGGYLANKLKQGMTPRCITRRPILDVPCWSMAGRNGASVSAWQRGE